MNSGDMYSRYQKLQLAAVSFAVQGERDTAYKYIELLAHATPTSWAEKKD